MSRTIQDIVQLCLLASMDSGYKDIVNLILDHPNSQNIEIDTTDEIEFTTFMLACRKYGRTPLNVAQASTCEHITIGKLFHYHHSKSKNFVSNKA